MSYHGTNWLDVIDQKQDAKIKAMNVQAGDWVCIEWEYGDVWHQVKSVGINDNYYSYLVMYKAVDSKKDNVQTDMIYFYRITKVAKQLPDDARCVFCEAGAFSQRRNNLHKLQCS